MHEDMRPKTAVKRGSNRSFGFTFAVVFLLVGAAPWITHRAPIRMWAVGAAIVFAIVAFLIPQLLEPLNKIWFRFGLVLHRVINPLVMGLIFFGGVVPLGFIMRLRGKDLLDLRRDRGATSYWIMRDANSPSQYVSSRQF